MDALVNVDFEDVKTVMSEPGKAMMGTATAGGPERARKAAESAVACPLLEGIDLSGAKGVLVLIAASRQTFRLSESKTVMNTIRVYAHEDAHVIFGPAYDETLGDQMRVTVIATGLTGVSAQATQAPPQQVLRVIGGRPATVAPPLQGTRTGTDNVPVLGQAIGRAPLGTTSGDYTGLGTPSVWRNARSRVDAMASNGMDEIDIPAFLRKQAD
jgi:cell division protein FtsZ